MVKITLDGQKAEILFSGNPKEIAMDMGAAISGIYQGLQNLDRQHAELFQMFMGRVTGHSSPVWEAGHEMTMVVMNADIKKSDTPADQS